MFTTQLECRVGRIELFDKPMYKFGSLDNVRCYSSCKALDDWYATTSIHGILVNSAPLAVFGDSSGCGSVHAHSAIMYWDRLLLVVGRHVVCLRPYHFLGNGQ